MKNVAYATVLLVIAAVPAHAGAVAISPVPEPATIGLVASGIGALGAVAWIKSRKK